MKIEKTNNTYTMYINDVLANTVEWQNNHSQLGIGLDAWNGATTSNIIKNIKIY